MRVVRAEGAFWDVVDGRTVVCDPDSGELYRLNATAAYLWEVCDDTPVESLAAQLAGAYPDQPIGVLVQDTACFVRDMCEKGLLAIVDGEA